MVDTPLVKLKILWSVQASFKPIENLAHVGRITGCTDELKMDG